MLLPEKTAAGVAAVLNARSAWVAAPTTSVAVAELEPNAWFVAVTVAVSLITVPLAVPAVTRYLIVKVDDAPAASPGFVQVSVGAV